MNIEQKSTATTYRTMPTGDVDYTFYMQRGRRQRAQAFRNLISGMVQTILNLPVHSGKAIQSH